jgi:outer membrane receptor protein involved in Fe transport
MTMKSILTAIILLLLLANFAIAQTHITGSVTDTNGQPLAGANVLIKGKVTGTVTGTGGSFQLNTSLTPPLTLVISMVGYVREEFEVVDTATPVTVSLGESNEIMNEVVITASRVEESILRSPVTIEKMSITDIRESPSFSFYESLQNLKGVEMVTSGLTFKQINTRGFNHTGNSRFLQLIDFVDNQTPGLGFSVGNMLGAPDLDMESAELIPGAASALYGPVAFNGVLHMRTKDPFQYPGLSAQAKVGFNHFNEEFADPTPMYDFAIRYAKSYNNRFAFKVNASYFTGLDFFATNYTDVDTGTPVEQRGENNPARDALNIYGDEAPRNLPGIGRVSRTGYEERHVTDYDVYSLKLNGALHYRLNDNMELIYQYNFSKGTANYTGSNRFSINNFVLQQHRVELKGANYFLRAYSTSERSNDSYNAKGLGQLITKTWVQDLDGNLVPENQADDMWYLRYEEAFNGNIDGVTPGNHAAARAFADQGRYLPGTPEFEAEKKRLIGIQGLSGAGIFSESTLYHVEGQYDLSQYIDVLDVQVGGNFRRYDMFTNGTLFDDKNGSIPINEGGAYVQASKSLINDNLKFTASIRYDKNQNFEGRFTPRGSAVYTVGGVHHFRTSYQTGFRNPTPGDQYIKLNAGPITILGGVPDNSRGMTVYQNSFTTASLGPFFGTFEQLMMNGATFEEAVMQAKDQLVKSDVEYIKPERVRVFEIGYKGLFSERFLVDVSFYRSSYNDFLLNQVVIEPESPVLAPDGSINPAAAFDLLDGNSHLYQLYTNASDRVTAQGAALGLMYVSGRGYTLGGNVTWSDFDLRGADPNDIPAFNNPKYRTSVTFGNHKVTDKLGFNIAWRWQDTYEWVGTFNQLRPGTIEAFSVVDAQVSYKMLPIKSILKIGASNLFNKQVYEAYGSPSIGAIYYLGITFDEFLR